LAEKRLVIEHADPVLLFGLGDVYLRKLEAAFPETQIIARGNQLILRGESETLACIERAVRELIVVLNRNGQLLERDVDTVLALFTAGDGAGLAETVLDDVILFTPSGTPVRAKTPNQRKLVEMARKNDIVFAIGPAGTGKTYTAVALAVAALKARQVKRIVLSRPAVEAGERLGFLPGDFREKIDPYLRPLYDALEDMLPRERLRALMEQNVVEIVPLAYMRGRTLNSAFVILDEAQNATTQQMKMFLTRLGANSRAIVTGDITQTDLPSPERSGLVEVRHVLEGIEGIGFVYFDREDVVRHRLVKDIIEAYERFAQREQNGNGRTTVTTGGQNTGSAAAPSPQ
jgi:phosphate starvation-inducible PhoH-like protein